MMTYLMSFGFTPSFVSPSMISGLVAHAKFVSMMMIPALVCHRLMNVLRNSCPAAVLAAAICASISLCGACARAAPLRTRANSDETTMDVRVTHSSFCRALAHAFRREDVAIAVNRPQKSGGSRIRLDLLSQPRHCAIERARRAGIEKAPDFPEQLIAK